MIENWNMENVGVFYPEYDPILSQNIITYSFDKSLPNENFNKDVFTSFVVIMNTNRQTDGQTNKRSHPETQSP